MIFITKEKLLELLQESFDAGCYGYYDLRETVTEEIANEYVEEASRNKIEDNPPMGGEVWRPYAVGVDYADPIITTGITYNDSSIQIQVAEAAGEVFVSDGIIHNNNNEVDL